MNKKGFVLIETLVVTIFTLVTFTILYNSAVPLLGKYKELSYYDDLDLTYDLYHISNLVKNDSRYNELINNHYKSITCTNNTLNEQSACYELFNVLKIDTPNDEVIFLNTSYIQELKNDATISNDIKNYLEYINVTGNIIILQNDGYVSYLNLVKKEIEDDSEGEGTEDDSEVTYGAPTVSISISGTSYSDGYKSGAVATITCEAEDGISSYKAKDNTGDTGTWVTNTSTKMVKKITLSSASSSRKITVSCTSTNDLTNTKSKTVKIYVYSASSVCGISSYSYNGSCSCYNSNTGSIYGEQCNANIYAYGSCSSWCRDYQANDGSSYTYQSGSCSRSPNYKSCYHT